MKSTRIYRRTVEQSVSRQLYEFFFHELNFTIKALKKDTFYMCDKNKYISYWRRTWSKVWEGYLADVAYLSKTREKETAIKDDSKVTPIFDMQQCLPSSLRMSIAFCKRVLCNCKSITTNVVRYTAICGVRKQLVEGQIKSHIVDKYLLSMPPYMKNVFMYLIHVEDKTNVTTWQQCACQL